MLPSNPFCLFSHAPKNLYDLVYLGAGVALLGSLAEPPHSLGIVLRRAQARVSAADRKRRTRRLILMGSYLPITQAQMSVRRACAGRVGRAEREPFGHTRRLEPQLRGAVTRRAVAQRRSRASGLTRPSAEAIRGF